MKRFSLATVVGSALMLSGSAFAESPEILDLRGIHIEAPRLAHTHVTSQLASLASRTDARHLIVRLVEDLDRPGRDRIAEEGIQLLSCLGPRTWIASTSPAVVERAASFSDRIEWAGPLPREAKLHPFLAAGGVPEWTIDRRALEAFIEGRDADVERVMEQITESDDPIVALYVLAQGDIELGGFTALLEAGG
ncbi:MAG: hypothetical protein P8I74_03635, partial [Phycisphaerales bacterium]|nr:hypothetical protein [Phycisphaerales bacterium]